MRMVGSRLFGYNAVVGEVAFVLGGGGLLGVCEVGMARALLEAGVRPDLVVGTSIGAINGAVLACDPTPSGAAKLMELWDELAEQDVLSGSLLGRIGELVRTRTSLHSNAALRQLLHDRLPAQTFAETKVRFECVAASIEHAQEHWFTDGDLVAAVLASSALPGIFPAVEINGEHFLDGGLVNSIPIARAVRQGADEVWVLHVGRIEEPLSAPRFPWEVGFVAFEIARRHRFHTDLAFLPDDVTVHVLPTGMGERRSSTWSNLRYRDQGRVGDRAELAYQATRDYLADLRRTG
jgi:NTE family protein